MHPLITLRPPEPLGDMKVREATCCPVFRIWSVPPCYLYENSTQSILQVALNSGIHQESYCKRRGWSNELKMTIWLLSVFSRRLHPPKVKYSFAWRADMIGHTIFLANQLINVSSTESTAVAFIYIFIFNIRYINILIYSAFTSKFIVHPSEEAGDSLLPCDPCFVDEQWWT